jgi:glycosyltransferase involved in cell wall biosynthesis
MAPLLSERRRLVIVGDGEERDALRAQVARTPDGAYVHMIGVREDVERILAALDAFALTSRTEGLPLGLLEAMAMGLPAVSTAVGGIPDLVVHGRTGLLFPEGERAPLTELLESLSEDDALAQRLGGAGRDEVLARHSVEHMASAYAALYERALRERRTFLRPARGVA